MAKQQKKPALQPTLRLEDLTEDEVNEQWISDQLADIARSDDTDPFLATAEISIARYLAGLARDLAGRMGPTSSSPDFQMVKEEFWHLHRRKMGAAGIRKFVAERFQQCNQLLAMRKELREIQQIELDRRAKKSRKRATKNINVSTKYSSKKPADKAHLDLKPILRLQRVLAELDEFLEILETDPIDDRSEVENGPDVSASLGLGLAFGLELGFAAAELAYHSALARERDARQHHKKTGQISMRAWRDNHPDEAMRLISDVLKKVFIDNLSWHNAYETAGVEMQIETPSTATVGRMVEREVSALLSEIRMAIRSRCSLEPACDAVSNDRNAQGYELSSRLLQELANRDAAGTLPGSKGEWLDQLQRPASQKVARESQAMDRDRQRSVGDVVGYGIAAYNAQLGSSGI